MTGGIPGSYLLETVQLGGGYTVAWFMEKIAGQPGQDVANLQNFYDQAASAVPPGSAGLVVVPYWNSVLGPYWDPFASGIIVGWRGFHRLPHLYRAILEGVAFEQYLGTLGVEKALGQPVKRYIAMGGGAQNDLWCQIVADITNKPVFRATTTETAALGAGILAATAVGCYANAREAAQEMTHILPQPIEPDALDHAFYNRLFEEVYRPLFPALQLYLDRLASIANSNLLLDSLLLSSSMFSNSSPFDFRAHPLKRYWPVQSWSIAYSRIEKVWTASQGGSGGRSIFRPSAVWLQETIPSYPTRVTSFTRKGLASFKDVMTAFRFAGQAI